MRFLFAVPVLFLGLSFFVPGAAAADSGEPALETPPPPPDAPRRWDRWGDFRRTPAFEVNVLWPFFPGGLVDLKAVIPVLRPSQDVLRGEAIVGLHSDFGWRVIREDGYGKVAILAAKIGYRQFFARGFHAEATINTGWRHEKDNVYDGTTLDSFIGRLWLMAGWQMDLSERAYVNVRGGPGIHVFRVGDRFADKERPLTGGGDVNLGVRF